MISTCKYHPRVHSAAEARAHYTFHERWKLSKIILEGYILVPDSDLESVKEELPSHIELTRQEEGCLVFEILQVSNNENQFRVYEEFINQNAFDLHQKRARNSKWGRISANVKRHYKIRGI